MNIEKIWLEYKTALKSFLHSKVSNESDVEDLLQEVLLKTYNNLSSVKKQTSIKSWLFQIANHTIIDFYRKKSRDQELLSEDIWQLDESNDTKIKLSHCMSPFINALPTEQMELLKAIDLGGKSQKAYAEEINVSYSTLKSRVQKSRAMLKEVFDDCCHFQLDRMGNVFDYDLKPKQVGKCN